MSSPSTADDSGSDDVARRRGSVRSAPEDAGIGTSVVRILDRSGDPGACRRTRPTDAEAQGFVAQGAVLDDGHRVRLEPRVAAVDGDLDRGALAPTSRVRISASRDGPRRRATPPSLLYSSLAMNADAGSGQMPVVHDGARRSRQLWRRVVGSAVVTAAVLVTAGCGIGQLKPAGAAADAFGSAVAAQQWASAAAMVSRRRRSRDTAWAASRSPTSTATPRPVPSWSSTPRVGSTAT